MNNGEASRTLRHTDTMDKKGLIAAEPTAEQRVQLLGELQKGKATEADVRARLHALPYAELPTGGSVAERME